jgi:leader peptidase (prepilin peptidase)/N-methyltransferase
MEVYTALPPWLLTATAGLLGLIVGSFLNVVIHRLPIMMERSWRAQCRELLEQPENEGEQAPFNLVVPRSRCPSCGHLIRALENIPVLSYLLQRGRCRHCGTHISIRYPVIEILTALLTAAVVWHFGPTLQAAAAILLTWALVALTFIDLDHHLLPDDITLPFLWFGVAFSFFGVFTNLTASVAGAMAGYLALWSIYHLFRLLTGKEGMGYGDFKLLAMLGAWMGWQQLPMIILLSSLVGAAVGISMILLRGHDRNVPIPFGPYLAAAGWLALVWGDSLTGWYLGYMGS